MKSIVFQDYVKDNDQEIGFEVEITGFLNQDTFIDDIGLVHIVDDSFIIEGHHIIQEQQYTPTQLTAIDQLLTSEYLLTTFQKCIRYE